MSWQSRSVLAPLRPPAVAGSFYPASGRALQAAVAGLFASAQRLAGRAPATSPMGLLLPHAGFVFSGVVAAIGWSQLSTDDPPPSVVLLGTNHAAPWLDGIAVWDVGAWQLPTGDVAVDVELAADVLHLGPPFVADRDAHAAEHSIEVQLPLLKAAAPGARIVALAVSTDRGEAALDAGSRLGELLAARRAAGHPTMLAISSDMAHYPPAAACREITDALLPPILALDAGGLARAEADVSARPSEGLVCGMCGIQPAIVGLAALTRMGADRATPLAKATSADAGGPPDRTVGYLSVRFD